MTPTESLITQLRQPPQPAHGAWQIYANVQMALATLIEQNAEIIKLLGPTVVAAPASNVSSTGEPK
jgi:hypothetical protein